MMPKARVRIMLNAIQMYSDAILYDDTIDSIRLERYTVYIRQIKERCDENIQSIKIEEAKQNQLNLFNP